MLFKKHRHRGGFSRSFLQNLPILIIFSDNSTEPPGLQLESLFSLLTAFPVSLQSFLSSVRTETVNVNTSAAWSKEMLSVPALTDTSWHQMANPATPTVRDSQICMRHDIDNVTKIKNERTVSPEDCLKGPRVWNWLDIADLSFNTTFRTKFSLVHKNNWNPISFAQFLRIKHCSFGD